MVEMMKSLSSCVRTSVKQVDDHSRGVITSQKRVVVMEPPRPRAKTPPGVKPSSSTPVASHLQRQVADDQESEEASSDWDETR